MEIDREKLHKLYMEWVDNVTEECDWKTSFGPKEIVGAIATILENNIEELDKSLLVDNSATEIYHRIWNIEDLARLVTRENFESLIEDIGHCLVFYIRLKEQMSSEEFLNMKIGPIRWKDDNIRGLTHVYYNDEEIIIKPKE